MCISGVGRLRLVCAEADTAMNASRQTARAQTGTIELER